MDKETLRMQMLSGIITEGEYAAIINQEIENTEKDSLNESMIGGIVGIGAVTQIPSREKTDYEMAFEHFLGERYQLKPNRERDDIKDINEEKELTYNDFIQMVRDDMMAGASPDERPSDERVKKDAKWKYNEYLQGTSVDDLFESENKEEVEEYNLGHNEIASLEPEGRFWIVSWRGMDGPKEKVFTDEDEARAFMNTLEEGKEVEEPNNY